MGIAADLPEPVRRLAERYVTARRTIRLVVPPGHDQARLGPEDAYAAQAALVAALGGRPAGYKIGATNPAVQAAMATTEPFSGRIVAEGALTDGRVRRDALVAPLLECELAFRLDRTPEGTSLEAVRAAIGGCAPALEIVDSCAPDWKDLGAVEAIANNGLHAGWLVGAFRPLAAGEDLRDVTVRLLDRGARLADGRGNAVLGDPLQALLWLVRGLAQDDRRILPGEIVLTGTMTPPVGLEPGQDFTVDYGDRGVLRLAVR